MRTASWTEAETILSSIQRAPEDDRASLVSPGLVKAISLYIEDLRWRQRADATIRGYACQLDAFAEALGHLPLREITADDIKRFLQSKTGKIEERLKVSTLRKEVAVLRAFYAFCISKGWARENPAKAVSKPAAPRFVTLPFDRRDIDRMFAYAREMGGMRGLETRALLCVLSYTGLRISDVASLRVGDYDRRTGYLTLPWTEKTGKPVRLRLHPDAVVALDELPKRGEQWFDLGGLKAVGSRVRKLQRRLEYLGSKVGVKAAPHRFRDTFAVELLTNGADLRTVQHLLGHDSITTTERHYAHFVQAHQLLLDKATSSLKFGDSAPRTLTVNAKHD